MNDYLLLFTVFSFGVLFGFLVSSVIITIFDPRN